MLPHQSTAEEVRVNVVTLIGNLASEVDLRAVDDDRQVATFLLAVDRPGKEEADFVRVSTWNKQAETCARYLTKGRRVAIDGRLRSSSWEDQDGNRRRAVEVVANMVQFLSPPPGKEGSATDTPFEAARA
jgi:single-strand DNA-binding protein